MKSIALPIGIMVGLALVVIIMKFVNRDRGIMTEYDERQKAVRGRSYMFGFYGIAITNVIMLLLGWDDMNIINMLGMNAFFLPILVGIITQFSHAIFNDSYVGLNNNMTRFMVVMLIVSIINFAAGIGSWVANGFIQEGKVYPGFINLEVGVMFIILCVEMGIKKIIDKKEEVDA